MIFSNDRFGAAAMVKFRFEIFTFAPRFAFYLLIFELKK